MSTTLSTIDTAVLGHLNLPSNESVYGATLRNQIENDIQHELFAEEFLAPWKEKKYLFATAAKTTITGAITSASTSILIGDATGWPTSGSAYIDGDIITFSGRTTTTLTGVTNIDLSHTSGASINPLYAMPSDFGAHILMSLNDIEQDYVSEFESSVSSGTWTTVTSKSQVEYIMFGGVSTSQPAILHYKMKPTTMTSVVDCLIPDEWAVKVIAPLAAGRLLIERGDDDDNLGTAIQNQGLKRKLEMKKYYGFRMGGFRKKFGVAQNYKPLKRF